jgi:hypothetical protein
MYHYAGAASGAFVVWAHEPMDETRQEALMIFIIADALAAILYTVLHRRFCARVFTSLHLFSVLPMDIGLSS